MGQDYITDALENLRLDEVTGKLQQLFEGPSVSLKEIVMNAITGNNGSTLKQLALYMRQEFFADIGDYRGIFVSVLLLGLLSAVFSEFGRLFEGKQIADLSYYIIYLMMVTVLLQVMERGIALTSNTLENIADFSRILIPTYCLSVGLAAGGTTAIAFYEIALLIIFMIERMMLILIIPCIYSYVFLAVMNGIGPDSRMDGIVKLLKKGIQLILKLVITAISCFGVLQAIITPVLDSVQSNTLQTLAASIPGIGGFINTATEVVYGSAVLVKNAVGVAGIILLIILCVEPLIQLAFLTFALKAAAAVMGIVADRRMNHCVEQISDGSDLLFRSAATAMALFVITISIVAVTTNRGF